MGLEKILFSSCGVGGISLFFSFMLLHAFSSYNSCYKIVQIKWWQCCNSIRDHLIICLSVYYYYNVS